jgi:hypothetical protein
MLGHKINAVLRKYHKIDVTIREKKYKINSQRLFDHKPHAKFTELEKRLQLIELALGERTYFSEPLPFSMMALISPTNQSTNLVLIAKLPSELAMPAADQKMEAFTLIFDKDRNLIRQHRSKPIPLNLSKDSLFYCSIPGIPSGKHECRVVMRNADTGKTGLASSTIVVPKRFEPGIKLYSPLILSRGKTSFYWGNDDSEQEMKSLGLTKYYPFDTSLYSPLIYNINPDIGKLLVLLPCTIVQFAAKNILISAQLTDIASGQHRIIPISLISQHSEQDTIMYQTEITMGKLGASRYSLYFYLEDIDTHKIYSYTNVLFTIN